VFPSFFTIGAVFLFFFFVSRFLLVCLLILLLCYSFLDLLVLVLLVSFYCLSSCCLLGLVQSIVSLLNIHCWPFALTSSRALISISCGRK
jgi:hypothetical protein